MYIRIKFKNMWVPWHYVHPQTDRATFQPTPYVHKIFCPLWPFSTVTLQPCNIFLLWHSDSVTIFYCDTSTMWHYSTVTFGLWQFHTVTLWPCDIFLLRHSDSVTIFYCDISTQSGWIVHPPQKVNGLSHCDISTYCNFGQPMAVTFCPLRILIFPVDSLSKLQLILTNDNLVTLSL